MTSVVDSMTRAGQFQGPDAHSVSSNETMSSVRQNGNLLWVEVEGVTPAGGQ